jgi:hypothetical protein
MASIMQVINLNKPSQNEMGIDFHHTVPIPALFMATRMLNLTQSVYINKGAVSPGAHLFCA